MLISNAGACINFSQLRPNSLLTLHLNVKKSFHNFFNGLFFNISLLSGFLQEATNVPKEILVLTGGIVFLGLIFLSIGIGSFCSIIGFLYPAYKSLEAIENRGRGDVTQWLIYWVVYSFFSVLEVFTDILLYWIPFYFAFKLAFLLWAMHPQIKGAKFLYDNFLQDVLKKNESKIDAALNDAKQSLGTIAREVAAATKEVTAAGLSTAAEYVVKHNLNSEKVAEKEN